MSLRARPAIQYCGWSSPVAGSRVKPGMTCSSQIADLPLLVDAAEGDGRDTVVVAGRQSFLQVVVAPLHLEVADGAADAAQVLVADRGDAAAPAGFGVAMQAGQRRGAVRRLQRLDEAGP